MGRKKTKAPKEKKKKKVNVILIPRSHGSTKNTGPYKLLEALIAAHHKDLSEAKIAMAWDTGPVKPDVDGMVRFGRVKRGSDLDRELAPYDFVLIVRKEIWNATDEQGLRARVDWLLCHCTVARDGHGQIVEDERDRTVYRMRKPFDMFTENVARFGFWQQEKFATCLARYNDSQRPLLKDGDDKKKKRGQKFSDPAIPPGATSTTTPAGIARHDPDALQDEAQTNGHLNAANCDWRKVGLGMLKLPPGIFSALQRAGVGTFGDLDAFRAEHGALGIAEIKGMGSEKSETLNELVEAYRDANPELFAAQPAAGS